MERKKKLVCSAMQSSRGKMRIVSVLFDVHWGATHGIHGHRGSAIEAYI